MRAGGVMFALVRSGGVAVAALAVDAVVWWFTAGRSEAARSPIAPLWDTAGATHRAAGSAVLAGGPRRAGVTAAATPTPTAVGSQGARDRDERRLEQDLAASAPTASTGRTPAPATAAPATGVDAGIDADRDGRRDLQGPSRRRQARRCRC